VLLAKAVRNTFTCRQTPLPDGLPAGLSDAFVAARVFAWRAFVKRNAAPGVPAELADLVAGLRGFLLPLLKADDVGRWTQGRWQ
jgi:hypothetical protein